MKLEYKSYPYGYNENQSMALQEINARLHNSMIRHIYEDVVNQLEGVLIELEKGTEISPSRKKQIEIILNKSYDIEFDKGVIINGKTEHQLVLSYGWIKDMCESVKSELSKKTIK